jgi:adenylate cyclase
LESLAHPGGICISGTAYDQVKNKVDLGYEYIGEQTVKNIPEPVRAYQVLIEPEYAGKLIGEERPKPRRFQWRVIAAAVVIVFVAGALAVWNFYFRRPSLEPASVKRMAFPLPAKPSIAVLPFVNMSGDPEQEYFSDGVTESIISALSNVDNMFVIARNSTFTYKGKAVKIQQVAEELGVRYVLEGSIQKSEDRVRITAQLIDAITGKHLWSERYDRDLKDLFALQDEITMKIITALRVKLTEGRRVTVGTADTDNLDAYLKYLQADKQMRQWNKEGNALARKFSEKALALDSEYAEAYLMLSATHLMDMMYGSSESLEQSLEKAEEMVKRAIALRGSFADARAFLGRIYLTKRKYDEAIGEGERALALAFNSSFVHAALAFSLGYAGRPEEAIPLYKKAIRLSPIPESWYLWGLGDCYRMVGRYEEAISVYKRAIKLSPDDVLAHAGAAAVYAQWERDKEAQTEAAEVLRIDPKFSLKSFSKGQLYKNPAELQRLVAAMRKAGLPEHPPLTLPDKPSIAVLPFDNLSDDPEQEYFSDGMTDDLITDLSKISGLFVIARNSAFQYKGKAVDVKKVSRELGVRYVLEGSVRRAENMVRINAQLIDATTGGHLWAERYDGKMGSVFDLQDRITRKIVSALALELTKGEQEHIVIKGTNNIEAYDAFLKGQEHYLRLVSEDFAKAIRYYEKATELDPNYSRAYAALAQAYWQGSSMELHKVKDFGVPWVEQRLRASYYLEKAMERPTTIAHAIASDMLLYMRQHEEAIAEAEKAVALDPNAPESLHAMSKALIFGGRPEEAIILLKRAMRLDPRGVGMSLFMLGFAQLYMGQLTRPRIFLKDPSLIIRKRGVFGNSSLLTMPSRGVKRKHVLC